ncbi:Uncharacterised protein [Pandoraea pulmonicola]|uniref:Uncharacterized protein n=1 Tax=Pandoraea pulmonicola TaxID=93221 RepID=A0AAJ4ZFV5_PANPU|nr:Uncharacterised protein [Pandoraea pulmonicola]
MVAQTLGRGFGIHTPGFSDRDMGLAALAELQCWIDD